MQELCEQEGREQQQQQGQGQRQGRECSWNNIVLAVLYGLREAGQTRRQLEGDRADTVLRGSGYEIEIADSRESRESGESRESSDRRFGQ